MASVNLDVTMKLGADDAARRLRYMALDATSRRATRDWRPYVENCSELFGDDRVSPRANFRWRRWVSVSPPFNALEASGVGCSDERGRAYVSPAPATPGYRTGLLTSRPRRPPGTIAGVRSSRIPISPAGAWGKRALVHEPASPTGRMAANRWTRASTHPTRSWLAHRSGGYPDRHASR